MSKKSCKKSCVGSSGEKNVKSAVLAVLSEELLGVKEMSEKG